MKNYGIRYEEYGQGWIPQRLLEDFLQKDKRHREYGKGLHQFVPAAYAIEINNRGIIK